MMRVRLKGRRLSVRISCVVPTCIEEHGLCVEVLESLMFEFDV